MSQVATTRTIGTKYLSIGEISLAMDIHGEMLEILEIRLHLFEGTWHIGQIDTIVIDLWR